MSKPGNGVRENLATMSELLVFMWRGKIWWLTPLVLVLFVLSFLVFLSHTSAVAPFIYALF